jgi:hypothetical protein
MTWWDLCSMLCAAAVPLHIAACNGVCCSPAVLPLVICEIVTSSQHRLLRHELSCPEAALCWHEPMEASTVVLLPLLPRLPRAGGQEALRQHQVKSTARTTADPTSMLALALHPATCTALPPLAHQLHACATKGLAADALASVGTAVGAAVLVDQRRGLTEH